MAGVETRDGAVSAMSELPGRYTIELSKHGYSEDELNQIYELGRFLLENGQHKRAEAIFNGLNEVVPEFAPAWLGAAYLQIVNANYDAAIHSARQALRAEPQMIEAMLYLIVCLATSGDFNAAGTYLGEVGEKIDSGAADDPKLIRVFKAQLARYQSRS